jgi:predicted GTPase
LEQLPDGRITYTYLHLQTAIISTMVSVDAAQAISEKVLKAMNEAHHRWRANPTDELNRALTDAIKAHEEAHAIFMVSIDEANAPYFVEVAESETQT